MREEPTRDVVVIGAGIAGLTAARALAEQRRSVLLVDKSLGPGGRLATRRIGGATLDHGAQFFTIRSAEFARLVERWRGEGASIAEWCRGFAQAQDLRHGPATVIATGRDGYPRYVVDGGMNSLARHLARDLEIRSDHRALGAWVADGLWRVLTQTQRGPELITGRALLCTPPVPYSLAVLRRGDTIVADDIHDRLRAIRYDPCVALLAVLDRSPGLPGPGAVQFHSGPVQWLADNASKPVSAQPALTVHGAPAWSRAQRDTTDTDVVSILKAWLAPWLGRARMTTVQVKRWRHAMPVEPAPDRTVVTSVAGCTVAFAGDAFGHARVEGAVRSGLAAASALEETLTESGR